MNCEQYTNPPLKLQRGLKCTFLTPLGLTYRPYSDNGGLVYYYYYYCHGIDTLELKLNYKYQVNRKYKGNRYSWGNIVLAPILFSPKGRQTRSGKTTLILYFLYTFCLPNTLQLSLAIPNWSKAVVYIKLSIMLSTKTVAYNLDLLSVGAIQF